MRVEPFSIDIDEAVLDDLRERLARTRWPSAAPGEPWAQGTDLAYLRRLAAYWRRLRLARAGARLNRCPQFVADVDGVRIHFVHVRGGGVPLILTHGWPSAFSSCCRWSSGCRRLRPRDPVAAGLRVLRAPADGCTTRDVAALWHRLMQGLGYERYGAHGGDFGAAVTTYMALETPERLLGIHLSNLDNAPDARRTPLTAAERAFAAATEHWDATERGYSFIQGTKPQTLAYGLTDSPTAWRPGSSRSGAAGATPAATSRSASTATSCSTL